VSHWVSEEAGKQMSPRKKTLSFIQKLKEKNPFFFYHLLLTT